ncbi:MAG: electron transfer flavoprotein subunit alpha [Thermodesulfobacteriota bacterium]
MLKIDHDQCNACGLCEKTCPFGAIAVKDDQARSNESCSLCGACVNVCPQHALSIQRKQASAEELAGYRGVFIWAECEARAGELAPKRVVYELLSQGQRLADKLGQELVAVALGDGRLAGLESLCAHGADRVLRCEHELLGQYSTDAFTSVLSAVIAGQKPAVLLYGATPNGRELAPRVAARLRLGLTADCTGLDIDDQGQLVQTRPAFGGNIMASIIAPYSRPQTATVRPNVFQAAPPDPARPIKLEEVPVTLNKAVLRTKLVEETVVDAEDEKLESAKVIVTAGLGCRQDGCLEKAAELARALGGVLAASRPMVEAGLMPVTRQVGQSGTTVGPDLYIAVGVSGAIQHLVGMSSSKTVIAINQDPEAPIFKLADLGIVGDAREILPRLLEELSKGKGAADSD